MGDISRRDVSCLEIPKRKKYSENYFQFVRAIFAPLDPNRNQPQMNSRLPSFCFPLSDRQTSSPTFRAESKLNCRTDIKNLQANLLPALA